MKTKKPSVLLLFPPYSDAYGFNNRPPLGINYLEAVLKKEGFQVKAADFNLLIVTTEKLLNSKTKKYDFKKCFPVFNTVEECLKNNFKNDLAESLYLSSFELTGALSFDVIGFSVAFGHQLPRAVEMARLIRKIKPEIKIIIGGSQISLLTENQLEKLKKSALFDLIFYGDAEVSLPKILNNIQNFNFNNCQIYIDESKQNLNDEPFPSFVNFNEYFEPSFIPILIGKGCHWGKCSFCDYKKLSKNILIRKPEDVFKEIIYHDEKHKTHGFTLISDAIPPNWYLKLADIAIDNKKKLKTNGYMIHEKTLDENFFEKLEKAGVYEINFGTESLNNRILKLMNKKADYETIKENLKAVSKFNIVVSVNIIVDFPDITFSEIMEVADKIEELKNYIDSLNIQYFDLTYDCEVFNNPEKFGIIIGRECFGSHGFHSFKFKKQKAFSNKELEKIEKRYDNLEKTIKNQKRVDTKVKAILSN